MKVAVVIPVRNEVLALGQVLREIPTEAGTPPKFVGGVADGRAPSRPVQQPQSVWLRNAERAGGRPFRGRPDGDRSRSAERRSRRPTEAVHQLIVVDNGSTDGSAQVAEELGAQVVSEPTPGYGRACLAGIAALEPEIDTVVFLDGDHSDYPEEIPGLLAPIARGEADLVIGSRITQAQRGSLTLPQRVGNRLACSLINRLFGVRYTDLGPFRAIRRDALARLHMQDPAFGWTVEMQAKAARQGLRIVEIPVRYRRRIGRSKISGTARGTICAGWAIVTTIVRIAAQPGVRCRTETCAGS